MTNISENNLSWGDVDFIEEGLCTSSEPLSFQNADEIVISEACGGKSPFKVLGVARGCFAPIGEFSRNHRLYDQDHWEYILSKPLIQERLKSRDIIGCLGHADKKVDDKDIAEGKVSHIVSKLEVREDANNKPYLYGELEILDTPAGRILKGLYEGGANLFVSSRGAGKLLDVPGQDFKRVDKTNYYFENFDIVRAAGFPKAKPVFEQVAESKSEEVNEAANTQKVFDCDDRIAAAEKVRKEAKDQLLKMEGKPEIETYPYTKKVEMADNQIKRAKAEREKALEESSEISSLKAQVERLAAVVEKVVDNFYEEPVEEEKSDADYEFDTVRKNALANPNLYGGKYAQKSRKEARKEFDEDKKAQVKEELSESMDAFLHLLSETNISDEVAQEILGMIFNRSEEK